MTSCHVTTIYALTFKYHTSWKFDLVVSIQNIQNDKIISSPKNQLKQSKTMFKIKLFVKFYITYSLNLWFVYNICYTYKNFIAVSHPYPYFKFLVLPFSVPVPVPVSSLRTCVGAA